MPLCASSLFVFFFLGCRLSPSRARTRLLTFPHDRGTRAQDGVRLGDDETMLLLRYIVKLGCEPGAVGTLCGGSSPMDPIFWILHPIFEKALHVLWMSPQYRDSYNFEWKDGTCHGSKLDDDLPFTGAFVCAAIYVVLRCARRSRTRHTARDCKVRMWGCLQRVLLYQSSTLPLVNSHARPKLMPLCT